MNYLTDNTTRVNYLNPSFNDVKVRSITSELGFPGVVPAITNIITVGKGGSVQFNTIGEAIAIVQSGETIELYPGVYTESFTLPAGVRLIGLPDGTSSVIAGSDSSSSRVIMSNGSSLRGCTVICPSTGTNPAIDCRNLTAQQFCTIFDIRINGGGSASNDGILMTVDNTLVAILSIFQNSGILGDLVSVQGGNCIIHNLILNAGVSNSCVFIDGSNTVCEIQRISLNIDAPYSCTDIIRINNGTLSAINLLTPVDTPANNGLHITGDGCTIELLASILHGKTWDILVDNSLTGNNTTINYSGLFKNEKSSIGDNFLINATINALQIDNGVNDDSGIKITGQFEVGKKQLGFSSYFGRGAGSTVAMSIKSDNGAGNFIDHTIDASSRENSIFDIFQSISAGNVCYFGNIIRKFFTMHIDITTAMVYGAGPLLPDAIGSVIYEYWDGSAWSEFNIMSTNSLSPYNQNAQDALIRVEKSNIRFNSNIDTNWAKITIDSISAFWIRVRITNEIATIPKCQRIMMHGDTTHIGLDGFIQHYGLEMPSKTLSISPRYSLTGFSPTNASFAMSTNITLNIPNSSFAGNQKDGFGISIVVPQGIDSGELLTVVIRWMVVSTVTPADVELELITLQGFSTGDNVNNSVITEVSEKKIISINTGNDDGVLLESSFDVSIKDVLPNEQIIFALIRDSGSAPDTLTNSIAIMEFVVIGRFWH